MNIHSLFSSAFLDGSFPSEKLPNGAQRSYFDLVTHEDEIIRDKERMEKFECFKELLMRMIGDRPGGGGGGPNTEQTIFRIFCRIVINSFNIMNDDHHSIGIGLYLTASIFDHSCFPNAAPVFMGKNIAVRCIDNSPVVGPTVEFGDLRISYTNLLDLTEERKKTLQEQYYFSCECAACECDLFRLDEMKRGSMRCPNCKACVPFKEDEEEEEEEEENPVVGHELAAAGLADLVVNEEASFVDGGMAAAAAAAGGGGGAASADWEPPSEPKKRRPEKKCLRCTAVIPKTYIQEYLLVRNDVLQAIAVGKKGPSPDNRMLDLPNEVVMSYQSKMARYFHPCDKLYLDILDHCLDSQIRDRKWAQALTTGKEILLAFTALYPKFDVNTALLYLKLAKLSKLELDLGVLTETKSFYEKALQILEITHGSDHNLVKRVAAPALAEVQMQEAYEHSAAKDDLDAIRKDVFDLLS